MPLRYRGRVTDEPTDAAEPTLSHGVPPWPGGADAWPDDPHYDPELLERGDTRNVVDRYRYWRMEAIVADLDTRRHPFHVAIENWQHDMNIGSIVRTANAFAADTVHIIGRRRWNKRGAMVTDRYQHLEYHVDVAAFAEWAHAASVPIVAVDNVEGCRADRGVRVAGALRAAVRAGGAGALAPRRPPRPTRSWRSRSTARPGRSTRVPPPRSPCTRGC